MDALASFFIYKMKRFQAYFKYNIYKYVILNNMNIKGSYSYIPIFTLFLLDFVFPF